MKEAWRIWLRQISIMKNQFERNKDKYSKVREDRFDQEDQEIISKEEI